VKILSALFFVDSTTDYPPLAAGEQASGRLRMTWIQFTAENAEDVKAW
jgi:hypothetical protein